MMSKLLTTGQMIDQLKDGEIAKSTDGEYEAYWHNGLLKFRDKYGDVQERIVKSDQERKWRILPCYVRFEEAMNAFEEGKKVKFLCDDGKLREIDFDVCIEDNKLSYYTLKDLVEGKWIVKN